MTRRKNSGSMDWGFVMKNKRIRAIPFHPRQTIVSGHFIFLWVFIVCSPLFSCEDENFCESAPDFKIILDFLSVFYYCHL